MDINEQTVGGISGFWHQFDAICGFPIVLHLEIIVIWQPCFLAWKCSEIYLSVDIQNESWNASETNKCIEPEQSCRGFRDTYKESSHVGITLSIYLS